MNQKQHWNDLHRNNAMEAYAKEPSEFAKDIIGYFPNNAKVLELGCGLGIDSAFFAQHGHAVLSTDFSNIAVKNNTKRYANLKNLSFEVMDIGKPMKFDNSQFDIVYARLSLHYFPDKLTKKVFAEINRVLKSGGLLIFVCKSVDDPLYGQGEMVERDMFLRDGHVRHFFSEEYVQDCLDEEYNIEKMWSGNEEYYGKKSAFVKVIAKKISRELVDIVDENDNVLYQAKKIDAHEKGLLHRTVIAEVIDTEGRFTLVKQASDRQDAGQYVSPVGGHVRSGETEEEALHREALEEMGLKKYDFKYIGKAVFNREVLGRKENHYFILYEIYTDSKAKLNHESVGYEKFTRKQLRKEIKENPKKFGDAYYFIVEKFYPDLLL